MIGLGGGTAARPLPATKIAVSPRKVQYYYTFSPEMAIIQAERPAQLGEISELGLVPAAGRQGAPDRPYEGAELPM